MKEKQTSELAVILTCLDEDRTKRVNYYRSKLNEMRRKEKEDGCKRVH